jgi:hypothetical protein
MPTNAEVLRALRFRDAVTVRDISQILDYVDQEVAVAIGGHDNLGNHIAEQDLDMAGFNIITLDGVGAGVAGENIGVVLGDGGDLPETDGGAGGDMTLTMGASGGGNRGGDFTVTAGVGGGALPTVGDGGRIALNGGASDFRIGGSVTLTGGNTAGAFGGGTVNLTGGDGVSGGGAIFITAGESTGSGNFSGAQVGLFAGDGGGTFSGQGGNVRLLPGNRATTANADPGGVDIQGMLIRENTTLGTLSSNTQLELDAGFLFIATIQGAANVEFSFGRVQGNRSITCEMELTNGGAGTVTWDAAILWPGGVAPTLTVAGIDWLRFSTNDDGISWYGEVVGLDMT